jgi:hypothetical protein
LPELKRRETVGASEKLHKIRCVGVPNIDTHVLDGEVGSFQQLRSLVETAGDDILIDAYAEGLGVDMLKPGAAERAP